MNEDVDIGSFSASQTSSELNISVSSSPTPVRRTSFLTYFRSTCSSPIRTTSPLSLSPISLRSPASPGTPVYDGIDVSSWRKFDLHINEVRDEQERVQQKVFMNWINHYVPNCIESNIIEELRDGTKLIALINALTGESIPAERGRHLRRHHFLSNVQKVLDFLDARGLNLINIHALDIVDGNPRIILGLIWIIILRFHIEEYLRLTSLENSTNQVFEHSSIAGSSTQVRSPQTLQRSTSYSSKIVIRKSLMESMKNKYGMNVTDFGRSWRDGNNFLILIDAIQPKIRAVEKGRAVLTNRARLRLAFDLAHKHFGVKHFLDPEDVDVPNPDERSIMTYVTQILQSSKVDSMQKTETYSSDFVDYATDTKKTFADNRDKFETSEISRSNFSDEEWKQYTKTSYFVDLSYKEDHNRNEVIHTGVLKSSQKAEGFEQIQPTKSKVKGEDYVHKSVAEKTSVTFDARKLPSVAADSTQKTTSSTEFLEKLKSMKSKSEPAYVNIQEGTETNVRDEIWRKHTETDSFVKLYGQQSTTEETVLKSSPSLEPVNVTEIMQPVFATKSGIAGEESLHSSVIAKTDTSEYDDSSSGRIFSQYLTQEELIGDDYSSSIDENLSATQELDQRVSPLERQFFESELYDHKSESPLYARSPIMARSTSYSSKIINEENLKLILKDHFGMVVNDFGPSWRDGNKFLILVDAIQPQVRAVKKGRAVLTNRARLRLAFDLIDTHIGVKPMLDEEDVDVPYPNETLIMTYVLQIIESTEIYTKSSYTVDLYLEERTQNEVRSEVPVESTEEAEYFKPMPTAKSKIRGEDSLRKSVIEESAMDYVTQILESAKNDILEKSQSFSDISHTFTSTEPEMIADSGIAFENGAKVEQTESFANLYGVQKPQEEDTFVVSEDNKDQEEITEYVQPYHEQVSNVEDTLSTGIIDETEPTEYSFNHSLEAQDEEKPKSPVLGITRFEDSNLNREQDIKDEVSDEIHSEPEFASVYGVPKTKEEYEEIDDSVQPLEAQDEEQKPRSPVLDMAEFEYSNLNREQDIKDEVSDETHSEPEFASVYGVPKTKEENEVVSEDNKLKEIDDNTQPFDENDSRKEEGEETLSTALIEDVETSEDIATTTRQQEEQYSVYRPYVSGITSVAKSEPETEKSEQIIDEILEKSLDEEHKSQSSISEIADSDTTTEPETFAYREPNFENESFDNQAEPESFASLYGIQKDVEESAFVESEDTKDISEEKEALSAVIIDDSETSEDFVEKQEEQYSVYRPYVSGITSVAKTEPETLEYHEPEAIDNLEEVESFEPTEYSFNHSLEAQEEAEKPQSPVSDIARFEDSNLNLEQDNKGEVSDETHSELEFASLYGVPKKKEGNEVVSEDNNEVEEIDDSTQPLEAQDERQKHQSCVSETEDSKTTDKLETSASSEQNLRKETSENYTQTDSISCLPEVQESRETNNLVMPEVDKDIKKVSQRKEDTWPEHKPAEAIVHKIIQESDDKSSSKHATPKDDYMYSTSISKTEKGNSGRVSSEYLKRESLVRKRYSKSVDETMSFSREKRISHVEGASSISQVSDSQTQTESFENLYGVQKPQDEDTFVVPEDNKDQEITEYFQPYHEQEVSNLEETLSTGIIDEIEPTEYSYNNSIEAQDEEPKPQSPFLDIAKFEYSNLNRQQDIKGEVSNEMHTDPEISSQCGVPETKGENEVIPENIKEHEEKDSVQPLEAQVETQTHQSCVSEKEYSKTTDKLEISASSEQNFKKETSDNYTQTESISYLRDIQEFNHSLEAQDEEKPQSPVLDITKFEDSNLNLEQEIKCEVSDEMHSEPEFASLCGVPKTKEENEVVPEDNKEQEEIDYSVQPLEVQDEEEKPQSPVLDIARFEDSNLNREQEIEVEVSDETHSEPEFASLCGVQKTDENKVESDDNRELEEIYSVQPLEEHDELQKQQSCVSKTEDSKTTDKLEMFASSGQNFRKETSESYTQTESISFLREVQEFNDSIEAQDEELKPQSPVFDSNLNREQEIKGEVSDETHSEPEFASLCRVPKTKDENEVESEDNKKLKEIDDSIQPFDENDSRKEEGEETLSTALIEDAETSEDIVEKQEEQYSVYRPYVSGITSFAKSEPETEKSEQIIDEVLEEIDDSLQPLKAQDERQKQQSCVSEKVDTKTTDKLEISASSEQILRKEISENYAKTESISCLREVQESKERNDLVMPEDDKDSKKASHIKKDTWPEHRPETEAIVHKIIQESDKSSSKHATSKDDYMYNTSISKTEKGNSDRVSSEYLKREHLVSKECSTSVDEKMSFSREIHGAPKPIKESISLITETEGEVETLSPTATVETEIKPIIDETPKEVQDIQSILGMDVCKAAERSSSTPITEETQITEHIVEVSQEVKEERQKTQSCVLKILDSGKTKEPKMSENKKSDLGKVASENHAKTQSVSCLRGVHEPGERNTCVMTKDNEESKKISQKQESLSSVTETKTDKPFAQKVKQESREKHKISSKHSKTTDLYSTSISKAEKQKSNQEYLNREHLISKESSTSSDEKMSFSQKVSEETKPSKESTSAPKTKVKVDTSSHSTKAETDTKVIIRETLKKVQDEKSLLKMGVGRAEEYTLATPIADETQISEHIHEKPQEAQDEGQKQQSYVSEKEDSKTTDKMEIFASSEQNLRKEISENYAKTESISSLREVQESKERNNLVMPEDDKDSKKASHRKEDTWPEHMPDSEAIVHKIIQESDKSLSKHATPTDDYMYSTSISKTEKGNSGRVFSEYLKREHLVSKECSTSVDEKISFSREQRISPFEGAFSTSQVFGRRFRSPMRLHPRMLQRSTSYPSRNVLRKSLMGSIKNRLGIRVSDFGQSWRDGRNFLKLIDAVQPQVRAVKKGNAVCTNRGRLQLAFDLAHKHFGLSPALDAEAIDVPNPNEESIMAYVAQLLKETTRLQTAEYFQARTAERGVCAYLRRAFRRSLPLQVLLLLLLGAAALIPTIDENFTCVLVNNLGSSFEPVVDYPNGPPPV